MQEAVPRLPDTP